MLWADPKVQYLVLFVGNNVEEKAIVTVGPELDYTTLEEIADVEVDGLVAAAFVKSRHYNKFDSPRKKILDRLSNAGRELSRNPFDGIFGVGNEGNTKAPAIHAQGDTPSLAPEDFEEASESADDFGNFGIAGADDSSGGVAAPSASALEKATQDEGWAEIKQREDDLENLRQELLAREAFITESENRLLEISQQHHERSEELNHKLESLKKWEMQISERERRVNKLEASKA